MSDDQNDFPLKHRLWKISISNIHSSLPGYLEEAGFVVDLFLEVGELLTVVCHGEDEFGVLRQLLRHPVHLPRAVRPNLRVSGEKKRSFETNINIQW